MKNLYFAILTESNNQNCYPGHFNYKKGDMYLLTKSEAKETLKSKKLPFAIQFCDPAGIACSGFPPCKVFKLKVTNDLLKEITSVEEIINS